MRNCSRSSTSKPPTRASAWMPGCRAGASGASARRRSRWCGRFIRWSARRVMWACCSCGRSPNRPSSSCSIMRRPCGRCRPTISRCSTRRSRRSIRCSTCSRSDSSRSAIRSPSGRCWTWPSNGPIRNRWRKQSKATAPNVARRFARRPPRCWGPPSMPPRSSMIRCTGWSTRSMPISARSSSRKPTTSCRRSTRTCASGAPIRPTRRLQTA